MFKQINMAEKNVPIP